MTNDKDIWPAGMTIALHAKSKKITGAGNIYLYITPGAGKEIIMQYGYISINTVAAARTVSFGVYNSSSNLIRLIGTASLDTNHSMNFPAGNDSGMANGNESISNGNLFQEIIAGDDRLLIHVASAAVDEEITLRMRYRTRGARATLSVGADNTLTTTRHEAM